MMKQYFLIFYGLGKEHTKIIEYTKSTEAVPLTVMTSDGSTMVYIRYAKVLQRMFYHDAFPNK